MKMNIKTTKTAWRGPSKFWQHSIVNNNPVILPVDEDSITPLQMIESWGLSHHYYLARAFECIALAGKTKPEICNIQSALRWLKRIYAQQKRHIEIDEALNDWQLDDDLSLALDYIFCAATSSQNADHIKAAIRTLENRLNYLKEQNKPKTVTGEQK